MFSPTADWVIEFSVWVVMVWVTYLVDYGATKNIICPRWFQRCCRREINFQDGGMNIAHLSDTPLQRAHNFNFTTVLGILLWFSTTKQMFPIDDWEWWYIIYPFVPAGAGLIFGYLGEFNGMDTACSLNSCPTWPWQSKLAYFFLGLAGAFGVGFNIYLAYEADFIGEYIALLVGVPLYYLFQYLLFFVNRDVPTLHVHHWIIGYYAALMFRFPHPISRFFCLAAFGISIEGSVAYQLTTLFSN